MYDKQQIGLFQKDAIKEYNRDLIVEKIVNVKTTEQTDGSFIQIGIRPIIEDDIFMPNSGVDPRLPSVGRMIAIGERDYLISELIKNRDIENIKIDDIKDLFVYLYDLREAIILISTKFHMKLFNEFLNRIDFEEKYPRLDKRYRIEFVPEKVLNNKIIIIDKNSILWEKQKFYNEFTEKDESIKIDIVPYKEFGKVDITIRSVNKIKYLNPDLIRILEASD